MSELFREALRRYRPIDAEWEVLLREMRAIGERLGMQAEANVERLSDEAREEKLRKAGR